MVLTMDKTKVRSAVTWRKILKTRKVRKARAKRMERKSRRFACLSSATRSRIASTTEIKIITRSKMFQWYSGPTQKSQPSAIHFTIISTTNKPTMRAFMIQSHVGASSKLKDPATSTSTPNKITLRMMQRETKFAKYWDELTTFASADLWCSGIKSFSQKIWLDEMF